jgi:formylglycine-generating enzyme required for sulfatase activity
MMSMLPERLHWIIEAFEPEGDPWLLLQIGRELEAEGNLEGAAAVYDRAYGLEPTAEKIRQARAALLDRLAVREHGLVFRYVPGGPFLMGNPDGEEDEKPWHPVWLSPYWLSETPISWADFCRLMAWMVPPHGGPQGAWPTGVNYLLMHENQLRSYFCKHCDASSLQERRRLWSARRPGDRYDTKPMVAIGWQGAEELAQQMSKGQVLYTLPTEAQWEKAARGGLIGARHAWGNDPPTADNCDFNHFYAYEIRPSKTFASNGYGLYAMNGGVWEWTADWYDHDYYRHTADHDPRGPDSGEEKVLRGGSWADCADVVTVSFRMSRHSSHWRADRMGGHYTPTLGFRLCREVVGQRWP